MTNIPTTLTYTLEEVLQRFEQRFERQFAEINQKMDKQFAEVNEKMDRRFAEVNEKMDRQFAEINQQFIEVNQKLHKLEIGQVELSGELKTLDQKIADIDKRLDNQEFINRGALVALIVALIGGTAKLFGWMPSA